jgi:hypothetical protein
MTRSDSWEERYLAVVPEKLTAQDAAVLIELMCEDPQRLARALEELAASSVEALEGDSEP